MTAYQKARWAVTNFTSAFVVYQLQPVGNALISAVDWAAWSVTLGSVSFFKNARRGALMKSFSDVMTVTVWESVEDLLAYRMLGGVGSMGKTVRNMLTGAIEVAEGDHILFQQSLVGLSSDVLNHFIP